MKQEDSNQDDHIPDDIVRPPARCLPVPDSPDKKTFLISAKKAWDKAHPGKKRRTHEKRIIEAIKEVLIAWPHDQNYTANGIVKRVKQKFESRKESFIPVDSSIWRYARVFLVLLRPFHRQTRSNDKDRDWLSGRRGMPRSEAAINHVTEAVVAVIPYLNRIEMEWDRLYKDIAEWDIKHTEELTGQIGKLNLEVSRWIENAR